MLPHAYELPAAVVLVVAGLITCLAGYRLFRFVLFEGPTLEAYRSAAERVLC